MDYNIVVVSLNLTVAKLLPLVLKGLIILVLLFLGWLIARGLGWLTTWILKKLQLDKGLKTLGFNSLLDKADIKKSPAELLGELVYWLAVIKLVIWALVMLGVPVLPVIDIIILFTGTLLVAAFVLGVGLFLATLVSGIVRFFLINLGIEGAKTASRFIYFIVITFTLLAVFSVFGIPNKIFADQINVVIGAFGLAAAIAFGLGCKDMAADFLHNLFKGK